MNKTLLIFKNELITVISRRSYFLTLLLVPLISIILVQVLSSLGSDTTQAIGQIFNGPATQDVKEGYIDEGGLIREMPAWLPEGRLQAFSTKDEAREALNQGKISGFYVVPTNYITDGKLYYIRVDFNPLVGMDQSYIFQSVLRYNLIGGNQQLAMRLDQPLKVETVSFAPTPARDQDNLLTFFLPYAVTMLFYITILASATLMLNSVTTEKQNRVMEILMVSAKPIQMLVGKIIALGIAGLLQTLVWFGMGLMVMRLSGKSLNIPVAFQLPASILIWGAVFFVLGYALYASLMAGVGALVPNLREASQATTVMIIPLVIPLALLNTLVNDPGSTLSMIISIFPLTAPVAMMTRLAAGSVPTWQPAVAAALLILTAWVIIRAVAGMFRAQTLLSGQEFNFRRFFATLTGRQ